MAHQGRDSLDRRLEERVAEWAAETARPRPGWAYDSPAEFVLCRGRAFEPHMPVLVRSEREKANYRYANAFELVIRDDALAYAEGYALSFRGGLMPHAWAVDRSGRAYEPTWSWFARPRAYYGVVFATKYLIDAFAADPAAIEAGAIALDRYRVVRDPDVVGWQPGGDGAPAAGDNLRAWTAALRALTAADRPRRRRRDPRTTAWDDERGLHVG
jgi:hypothetical protein